MKLEFQWHKIEQLLCYILIFLRIKWQIKFFFGFFFLFFFNIFNIERWFRQFKNLLKHVPVRFEMYFKCDSEVSNLYVSVRHRGPSSSEKDWLVSLLWHKGTSNYKELVNEGNQNLFCPVCHYYRTPCVAFKIRESKSHTWSSGHSPHSFLLPCWGRGAARETASWGVWSRSRVGQLAYCSLQRQTCSLHFSSLVFRCRYQAKAAPSWDTTPGFENCLKILKRWSYLIVLWLQKLSYILISCIIYIYLSYLSIFHIYHLFLFLPEKVIWSWARSLLKTIVLVPFFFSSNVSPDSILIADFS